MNLFESVGLKVAAILRQVVQYFFCSPRVFEGGFYLRTFGITNAVVNFAQNDRQNL